LGRVGLDQVEVRGIERSDMALGRILTRYLKKRHCEKGILYDVTYIRIMVVVLYDFIIYVVY
jgi:hypothetical protein